MVLYEDLRIYTIWRTEMAQSRQQSMEYKKSATEWEILGELAERLHHFDEGIEAYQHCLSIRFSPKSMRGILKLYDQQNNTREMLNSLIRLIAWQYRWYSEVCAPFAYENKTNLTVLAGTPTLGPQTHRGGRRRQSPQYCPVDQSAAAGARSHPSILPTVRYVPEQR